MEKTRVEQEYNKEFGAIVFPDKPLQDMTLEETHQWVLDQREYLAKQAPLRAAWIAGDEDAKKQLRALVEETTAKCKPLTDTFTYSEEDATEHNLYVVILEICRHGDAYNTIIRTEIATSPESAIAQANDQYRYASDSDYEVEAHAVLLHHSEAQFIYQTNGG